MPLLLFSILSTATTTSSSTFLYACGKSYTRRGTWHQEQQCCCCHGKKRDRFRCAACWYRAMNGLPAQLLYQMPSTSQDTQKKMPTLISGIALSQRLFGLGGFAIAAAPAIVQFVGGTARDAMNYSLEMYEISDWRKQHLPDPIPQLPWHSQQESMRLKLLKKIQHHLLIQVWHTRSQGLVRLEQGYFPHQLKPFQKAYEGLAKRL